MLNVAWQPKLLLFKKNAIRFGSNFLNCFNFTAYFQVTCQGVYLARVANIISVDLQQCAKFK